ncbi:MAG TPA: HPP family protein [Noviherbaspirillum sp.]|nr:HPP family protein [Noviherbaspirillum sp.]
MNRLPRRRRIGLKGELALAIMPTVTVLLVLALVEALSRQRLLFASLASSAFLIYLDPQNVVNSVRTLVLSQVGSAVIGLVSYLLFGPGYVSGGIAMVTAIGAMIAADAMHPPAVSTALSFGLRAGDETNLALFCLAVGVTAVLIGLQRVALWMLRRYDVGS